MNILELLKPKKTPAAVGPWPDDMVLLKLGQDAFTLEDAKQDVLIFGEKGSGKTSGSGHLIARKYLEAGFGGLVVCYDKEEAELWRRYLKEADREADGRFFTVDGPYRFNFLNHEAKVNGVDFTDNLVTLLTDMASIRSRGQSSTESYWPEQKRKLIRNAISLLQLSGQTVDLRSLYSLIQSAPNTLPQAIDQDWRKASGMFQTLSQASQANGSDPEYQSVKEYWLKERPMLAEKTKATIDSDFTGMFDPLTRGKIGELFGTTTNIEPEDMFDGKVIVIDLPVSRLREVGQYSALIWIQLFQRAIDRRTYSAPYDRPVFIWEDEAHYYTTEKDALFQTTSRKKGVSIVRLTQNLPNFLDAYGRDGKHKVNSLLGNHVLKIFHRNSDPETNAWASEVIAKQFLVRHTISVSDGKSSASANQAYEHSCPPHIFNGLLNGGEKNDKIVEGIVFQSGRKWKGKHRWIKMKFRQ
jgi:hypothetical protein